MTQTPEQTGQDKVDLQKYAHDIATVLAVLRRGVEVVEKSDKDNSSGIKLIHLAIDRMQNILVSMRTRTNQGNS